MKPHHVPLRGFCLSDLMLWLHTRLLNADASLMAVTSALYDATERWRVPGSERYVQYELGVLRALLLTSGRFSSDKIEAWIGGELELTQKFCDRVADVLRPLLPA